MRLSLLGTCFNPAGTAHPAPDVDGSLNAYKNQKHDGALCEMFEPEHGNCGPPPI